MSKHAKCILGHLVDWDIFHIDSMFDRRVLTLLCVCAVVQKPGPCSSEADESESDAQDLEVDDPGLRDLARRLTDNALQGSPSTRPNALAAAPQRPEPCQPTVAIH